MRAARTFFGLGNAALLPMLATLSGAILGCAVDDRTLLEADAGAGAAGTGAGDGGGTGGSGGRTEEDATPPPRCVYPADESKTDCQTLVQNGGFHRDSSHWTREYDSVLLTWNDEDAAQNDASGSITVINTLSGNDLGFVVAGARQCLSATTGTLYVVGADVFMTGGEPQYLRDASPGGDKPKAGMSILFYENPDCTGSSNDDSFITSLVDAADVWTPIGGSKVAPEKVSSMAVRLIAMKPFRQVSMTVDFDNVLVRAP
jgi:hypothetical protein